MLVGLEAIRRRPGMYIGPDRVTANRLAAIAISAMVRSWPVPNGVFAEVRADGSLTIRVGAALAPTDTELRDGIEQPAILDAMLRLPPWRGPGNGWLAGNGSILVALAAPLGVSCRRQGLRLDAWFSRGGLSEPVRLSADPRPDATAIGFAVDEGVLSGSIDTGGVRTELLEADADVVAFVDLKDSAGDLWDALGDRLEAP